MYILCTFIVKLNSNECYHICNASAKIQSVNTQNQVTTTLNKYTYQPTFPWREDELILGTKKPTMSVKQLKWGSATPSSQRQCRATSARLCIDKGKGAWSILPEQPISQATLPLAGAVRAKGHWPASTESCRQPFSSSLHWRAAQATPLAHTTSAWGDKSTTPLPYHTTLQRVLQQRQVVSIVWDKLLLIFSYFSHILGNLASQHSVQ